MTLAIQNADESWTNLTSTAGWLRHKTLAVWVRKKAKEVEEEIMTDYTPPGPGEPGYLAAFLEDGFKVYSILYTLYAGNDEDSKTMGTAIHSFSTYSSSSSSSWSCWWSTYWWCWWSTADHGGDADDGYLGGVHQGSIGSGWGSSQEESWGGKDHGERLCFLADFFRKFAHFSDHFSPQNWIYWQKIKQGTFFIQTVPLLGVCKLSWECEKIAMEYSRNMIRIFCMIFV